MKSLLYWPYQIYAGLIFLPLVIILTLLFSGLTIIFSVLINPEWASRYLAGTWARLLAWLTPISVHVEGAENADRNRSYVVAINHQSQFDILVVYGWLQLDLKWVLKQELRKLPGLGKGCEMAGHIYVDRSNPRKARKSVNDALKRLDEGVGILFFPEGTRSKDGRLLPFKKGAFRTAIDQGLPVLPVTLRGTRDILPARSLRLFPGRTSMVIHPAIETSEMTLADLPLLRDSTREAISRAMPAELQ